MVLHRFRLAESKFIVLGVASNERESLHNSGEVNGSSEVNAKHRAKDSALFDMYRYSVPLIFFT